MATSVASFGNLNSGACNGQWEPRGGCEGLLRVLKVAVSFNGAQRPQGPTGPQGALTGRGRPSEGSSRAEVMTIMEAE
eukprot:8923321-Pyramimonas_sp.AAC.1